MWISSWIFFSCVWTTLVSAPISPRSFIIILRFLVSHKAQCWSSSDNYYMASELYRSTSKQFLKESLNIHLGLVAKTIDSTSFKSDIFKCTGSDFFFLFVFFFSGKLQVSSKWVWASGKNNYRKKQEKPRLLILGYLGAYLNGLIVHQLTVRAVEVRHNYCALTAPAFNVLVGLQWASFGWTVCVRVESSML